MIGERVVMITGAAGHLGRAVAVAAQEAGASLVLLDRSADHARDAGLPEGAKVLSHFGIDLMDVASIGGAAQEAVSRFGRLDGLVSTVGAFHAGKPVAEDRWADWNAMIAANLQSAVAACQAVIPLLQDGTGRIVTIGARPALKGPRETAAYAASKAAVVRLTESLAEELKDRQITANCVLPSVIDTPSNRQAMPKADFSRWVSPAAIADVIVFLLSERSRAISGASIPVFGRS